MTETKEEPARITMQWPPSLKEAVREKAGKRGLTDFVVEAVRAKLGIHDAHQADSKELNEVKFLAQRLADTIALGGEYEDPEETLRLMELPSWIQTEGWPPALAAVVRAEDPEPESVVAEPEPEVEEKAKPRCPYYHQEQQCEFESRHDGAHRAGDLEWGGPAVGDPGTVRSEPPASETPDLVERLRTKAAEKGVDMSGVDLKPASSIEKPAEPAPQPEPEPEAATSDICPDCRSPLVAGECWECA